MNVKSACRTLLQGKMNRRLLPLIFLAAGFVYLLFLAALNKAYNMDEFEHVHSAWYIVHGFVPYRDFFQHHNPLLWYLIAPVIALAGENAGILICLRMAMFALALSTAAAASAIAGKVSSRREAPWYCLILLLSCTLFVEKAVEIRPDVPMTLFGTLSVYFFIRHHDCANPREMVLSGLSAALAYLFLQKAVFLYAALSVLVVVKAARKEMPMKTLLLFFLCLMAGPVLIFAYYAFQGALYDYSLNAYVLNVSKLYSFSAWKFLLSTLRWNTGFWVLALAGILYGTATFRRNEKLGSLSLLGVMLFLPVLFVKTPWKQYYLPALALFSAVGACFLARVLEKARSGALLGFMLMAVIVFKPMLFLAQYRENRNRSQIELVEYVAENTRPDDLVYDGRNQFNLFRRDLHYFWYSTGENRNLFVYNALTGNRYGDYDVCSLIREKRPRVISDYLVDKKDCSVLNRYKRIDGFNVYMETNRP